MQPKNSSFSDRAAASAAAKKALLAKFKPKPAVTAPEPIDHAAEREARVAAIRAERQRQKEEREEARRLAALREEETRREAAAAAERARLEDEAMTDARKRAERKERKKAIKEAARAKKEMRVANRPPEGERERLRAKDRHERYEWDRA
jgi:uncharacterized protein (DUF1800 family)